jgi:hypothetical protein
MKRLLPLVLLSFLFVPAHASGDGCPPEQCGIQSTAVPGSPVLTLRPNGGLAVYDVRTGHRRFRAGYGLQSADGSVFYTAANTRRATVVRRRSLFTGAVQAHWRLGPRLWPGAVSADGRHLVLVDARSNRHRTRFVLLDTGRGGRRTIELQGNFQPEAVSRDGRRLFVIQYVKHGYRVRLYDLVGRALRPGELRPRNEDEPMVGYPAYAIGAPDGHWLLTLYVKPKDHESFVHALDLRRAIAYCLDLPGHGSPNALPKYALSLSPSGRTLVAANPVLGTLAEIDLRTLEVAPVVRFRGSPETSKYASNYVNAAFSPRGDLVYFGDIHALRAYDLHARRVRGPYLPSRIGGFAFTPDGRKLLVVRPNGGVYWLDAATGKRI